MKPAEPFASLAGATAVVTGAARGSGLQIASTLQSVGMAAVLVDRDGAELDRAVELLAQSGHVAGLAADLSVTGDGGLAGIGGVLAGLPPLAVWVNNAGVVSHQAAEHVDVDEFERVIRDNTASALRGCQMAFERMRAGSGDRAIVNITSLVVDKVLPDRLSYAASKAALQSVTRYAAQEWGRHGIRVNAISPGYVDTRLTQWADDDPRAHAKRQTLGTIALRRAGSVDDIANAVLFLCSPLSAYVTGHILQVDGGWHLS